MDVVLWGGHAGPACVQDVTQWTVTSQYYTETVSVGSKRLRTNLFIDSGAPNARKVYIAGSQPPRRVLSRLS